jgi:hypothetical protein
MTHYFEMCDGVANRPHEGRPRALVPSIPSLTHFPEDVCEILRQVRVNPLWVGSMEYVNTTAYGGADAKCKIHQPSPEATANRWYCVTIGTEVGVFTSWYVQPSISASHDTP